jgi:hypothetical protein
VEDAVESSFVQQVPTAVTVERNGVDDEAAARFRFRGSAQQSSFLPGGLSPAV